MSAKLHSTEAEQAVIGGMLLDNRAFFRLGNIALEDFHHDTHAKLFDHIAEQIKAGRKVDVLTVSEHFEGDADVDLGYVGELARNTVSVVNVGTYADIVRSRSAKRKARKIFIEALEKIETDDDVITEAMTKLEQTATRTQSDASFREVIQAADDYLAAARERRRGLGVSTCLPTLDLHLGGLYGSRVYTLGGRPGRFKSVFAWQVLLHAGRDARPVGMVSLEMPKYELGLRAIAQEIRETDLPIRVDDTSRTLGEISARICEWRHRYDMQLVVVDHIQLVRTNHRSRFEELAEISRRMKDLAMSLNMPILILSQISRDVERERRAPKLSDLRECGNLEQDSDVVLFIHCEESKSSTGPQGDEYMMLVAKNRGGPARTKPIPLWTDGKHAKIGERAVDAQ